MSCSSRVGSRDLPILCFPHRKVSQNTLLIRLGMVPPFWRDETRNSVGVFLVAVDESLFRTHDFDDYQ